MIDTNFNTEAKLRWLTDRFETTLRRGLLFRSCYVLCVDHQTDGFAFVQRDVDKVIDAAFDRMTAVLFS